MPDSADIGPDVKPCLRSRITNSEIAGDIGVTADAEPYILHTGTGPKP
jgi:hypothetical protein